MSLPETFVPGFHNEEAIRKMKYSKFGETGMSISAISLGTGGFSYLYGKVDVEECKEVVREALKNGVNYIDTAPFYGHGESEEVLGKCLEGIPRKAYYMATKVCRFKKEIKEQMNFTKEHIVESFEASLKRLKLDYVDLFQVHDVEFAPSIDMILNETLPAVESIVKSGRARFLGITGYPISTLNEILERSTVKINTVLCYCRLTMFDDTLMEYLPRFKARKLGIVCAAANGMGLLSSYGPQDWHPAVQEIRNVCTEAREYCQKNGVELGKLAIYHTLQQQGPDTVLIGMNNRTLLKDNLDVFYNGISPKEHEVYKGAMKILGKLSVKHWEGVEVSDYWKIMNGEKQE